MSYATAAAQQFAKSSTDAVTGYASAAFAAYADFAGQALGYWAQAVDTMMPSQRETSWYRHPDKRAGGQLSFTWPTPSHPALSVFGFPAAGVMPQTLFNPFALWMKAWPLQGNPASWPLAFTMMGMGMPRSVAYPLAQANTAAIEAANSASKVVNESFSAYRSDGGHASTHVLVQTAKVATTAMFPLGMALTAPWLATFNQMSRAI